MTKTKASESKITKTDEIPEIPESEFNPLYQGLCDPDSDTTDRVMTFLEKATGIPTRMIPMFCSGLRMSDIQEPSVGQTAQFRHIRFGTPKAPIPARQFLATTGAFATLNKLREADCEYPIHFDGVPEKILLTLVFRVHDLYPENRSGLLEIINKKTPDYDSPDWFSEPVIVEPDESEKQKILNEMTEFTLSMARIQNIGKRHAKKSAEAIMKALACSPENADLMSYVMMTRPGNSSQFFKWLRWCVRYLNKKGVTVPKYLSDAIVHREFLSVEEYDDLLLIFRETLSWKSAYLLPEEGEKCALDLYSGLMRYKSLYESAYSGFVKAGGNGLIQLSRVSGITLRFAEVMCFINPKWGRVPKEDLSIIALPDPNEPSVKNGF